MRDERRGLLARQFPTRQALGLVIRLHLGDQLCVAALGLDNRDDAGFLAAGIAADQPVRQMFALRAMTVVGSLDRMLLHQDPLVTAVPKRLDKFVRHLGMIGQGHFRGRKSAHTRKRVQSKNGRERVRPGPHVQSEILRWSRRRHCMTPGAAQPLDRRAITGVTRDPLQVVKDIVEPHLPHAMHQRA